MRFQKCHRIRNRWYLNQFLDYYALRLYSITCYKAKHRIIIIETPKSSFKLLSRAIKNIAPISTNKSILMSRTRYKRSRWAQKHETKTVLEFLITFHHRHICIYVLVRILRSAHHFTIPTYISKNQSLKSFAFIAQPHCSGHFINTRISLSFAFLSYRLSKSEASLNFTL